MVQQFSGYQTGQIEILIGRSSGCDIVIKDSGISGKHAKIFIENDDVFITDLKSLNGTFVNGRKINVKQRIGLYDEIILGDYILDTSSNPIAELLEDYGSSREIFCNSIKLNTKWLGKIFYFLMIITFFFPWITIKDNEESIQLSAFDFAFNIFTIQTNDTIIDYSSLHILFLVIFIGLILGLFINFFVLKISSKFNYSNLLSILIFILTMIYIYILPYLGKYIEPARIHHTLSVYIFLVISFMSIFEGFIEFYISERKMLRW